MGPVSQWRGRRAATVLDHFAQPAEIAAAIAWLLDDAAAFCCGTELLIDGDYSLR